MEELYISFQKIKKYFDFKVVQNKSLNIYMGGLKKKLLGIHCHFI